MENIDYRKEYRIFMREKIDCEYLKPLNKVKVYGENFIQNIYVVIFEAVNDFGKLESFLLIENNSKNKNIVNLKVFKNGHGYIASKQSILKNNIPSIIYDCLVANGIFESLKTEANDKDSRFGIHRLVLSLYDNCIGHKVHHINRHRHMNCVSNIVKMLKGKHKKIHSLPRKSGIIESIREQNKLKIELLMKSKKHRKRDNWLDEILKWRISDECKKYRKKAKE